MRPFTPPRRSRWGARGAVVAITGLMVVLLPGVALADEPGESNTITDVPGILVGHETRTGDGYQTGTTVVIAPDEATASYTSFGGGPGTKETDLLEPGGLVTKANAIVLSGGSAYGLDTTTGVMRWLEERGMGYPIGNAGVVPIVPAAILFDLGRGGDFSARPDADFGYAAADAASDAPVEMGRVGAGTGASWGLGSASVVMDNGYTVGAIVGLNPGGSPVNPDNCLPYAAFLELGDEFPLYPPNPGRCPAMRTGSPGPGATDQAETFNTTIAVVATDAPLNQTQAQRMSMIANSGLSRSIKPVHNLGDGDTVFALATTDPAPLNNRELGELYNAAADALGRAVVHALLEGETLGNRVAYCEQYPKMCGRPKPLENQPQPNSSTEDGAALVVPANGTSGNPPSTLVHQGEAVAAPLASANRAATPGTTVPLPDARTTSFLIALAAIVAMRALWLRRDRMVA